MAAVADTAICPQPDCTAILQSICGLTGSCILVLQQQVFGRCSVLSRPATAASIGVLWPRYCSVGCYSCSCLHCGNYLVTLMRTCVQQWRTSYTVISTGTMSPAIFAVSALYCLQKAMMLTPYSSHQSSGQQIAVKAGGGPEHRTAVCYLSTKSRADRR